MSPGSGEAGSGNTEIRYITPWEPPRARRFYEAYGFSCTEDVLDTLIGGKSLREVRYVYRLT